MSAWVRWRRTPARGQRARRDLGLSGIEFGVNIPGTVGGAVRMNANAYGGARDRVLQWVDVVTAEGTERRADRLRILLPAFEPPRGRDHGRGQLRWRPPSHERSRPALAQMRDQRRAAQPSGIKTFGSTFKNPDDEGAEGMTAGQLLAEAGCQGLSVGQARFSPKHANFVENAGGASTADIIALMAEGRRRGPALPA